MSCLFMGKANIYQMTKGRTVNGSSEPHRRAIALPAGKHATVSSGLKKGNGEQT